MDPQPPWCFKGPSFLPPKATTNKEKKGKVKQRSESIEAKGPGGPFHCEPLVAV